MKLLCGCYSANLNEASVGIGNSSSYSMCEEEIQELFKMPFAIAHLKVVTVRTGEESSPNCKQSETMEFRGRNVTVGKRSLTYSGTLALLQAVILQGETYFSIHHTQKLCPSLQEHNSSR